MSQIYHQLGHRYKWSLDSLNEDHTGDGVIVGPRYIERTKVDNLPPAMRSAALFDPQFFLPHSSQGHLTTYPFFPQVVAGGFVTSEWTDEFAERCAVECIRYQMERSFSGLVLPTRFYEGMPSDFIENQERLFIRPFLSACSRLNPSVPVYLQVIVTDQMIKDSTYRADLLNWITSIREIQGVYLIYHVHNRRKQIDDIEFLIGLLSFCAALKAADMRVVVGYCNTEALLLLCAKVDAVTIGCYENLRMFSIAAFEEREGTPRGPNARLYVPRLLQWVEYQYIGAIRRVVHDISSYIADNRYRVTMFEPTYNWHFTKPDTYKHYFIAFSNQLRRIIGTPENERTDAVLRECEEALREYENLREGGIVFDPESGGAHISRWITALNLWRRSR